MRRSDDLQISHVLPITRQDFGNMLARFQRQSNMVVRPVEGKWVIQKLADEGSSSPFMGRLMIGLMRLRDVVYTDAESRERFDRPFELVSSSLADARTTAKEIVELWEAHARKIASGEIARRQGRALHIDESVDKELGRRIESFINAAVRALKYGMQELAAELREDIGFLFKKQNAFDSGIAALAGVDPLLADYLRQVRPWSERLIQSRNDIEHSGWKLPRVSYSVLRVECAEHMGSTRLLGGRTMPIDARERNNIGRKLKANWFPCFHFDAQRHS